MDREELVQTIESCNSKQNALFLAKYIVENPIWIVFIFDLMENHSNKKAWKAAWVLDHVYLEKSNLLDEHIDTMIRNFMHIRCDSIRRIMSKLLSFYNIAEKVDGSFVNTCFDLLISETVAVAVKVNTMQILFNISQTYPELGAELKLILEEQIPNNTVAFKARAKRLLRRM